MHVNLPPLDPLRSTRFAPLFSKEAFGDDFDDEDDDLDEALDLDDEDSANRDE